MVLFRQQSEASGAVPRLLRVSPLRHSFRVTTSTSMDDTAYSSDADSTISVPDYGSQDLDSDKKDILAIMAGWFDTKGPAPSPPKVVVDKIVREIQTMDSLTSTSLILFSSTVVFLMALGYYYNRKLDKKFTEIEHTIESVNEKLHAKEVVQAFLSHIVDMSRRTGESMNMALYMSEMRRNARIRRPRRLSVVEDHAPEFLPSLRAERCQRDGVAVLDITDDDVQTDEEGEVSTEPSSLRPVVNANDVHQEDIAGIVDTPRPKRRPLAAKL